MSTVSTAAIHDPSSLNTAFALAMDIGSSSVRAALYDAGGIEIPGTEVKFDREFQTTPDGGAEMYADEAIKQVIGIIDEVLVASTVDTNQVEIVTTSCFWHSLVGVDQDGHAVTPLLGWADTRAARMVEELQRSFDESDIHSRTGCRFHPSYWPAKLLWLRGRDADAFRNVASWISFSELLLRRLFGKAAISVSMASATGLFNQRNCEWDESMLSYLDVRLEQLPRIADDAEFFSDLVGDYSNRWPQLKQARWFPAIGDGAANNIGAGCVTSERAALMIGTSGAMRVMWPGEVPQTVPSELWCYRADRQRVITGGALSDGGGLFAWMKKSLRLDGSDDDIERALDEMQPDEHGLTLLPFWSGERSTGWNVSARSAIIGLTQYTRPIDILHASMEAVSYRIALVADALDRVSHSVSIIASGGALVSSPVWTQMLADVLGRKITQSGVREASTRGAVLLALEMEGRIRDIADAPAPLARTFEPDMERHARYREGLERQQKLYERLKT